MPTGYTAFIEDGEITTGKDFLLLCSRAFGVAVDIKEEPLTVPTPMKFEVDGYYERSLRRSLEELEKVKNMNEDEISKRMIKEHDESKKYYLDLIDKEISLNKKYQKVRKEVEDWIPPTDEHTGIKKFALEQIDMCICPEKELKKYVFLANQELIVDEHSVKEYHKRLIESCECTVERNKESYEEAIQRAANKTKFMEDFVKSLENI